MERVRIGKRISGKILEKILIDSARELGYDYSLKEHQEEDYVLNPVSSVRKEKFYLLSQLDILGCDLNLQIEFRKNKNLNYFWLTDVISQKNRAEQGTAIMLSQLLGEEIPEDVSTPTLSIKEYLSLVSKKIYNGQISI